MLLYYHDQLSWVARSCGLPYSQREIRYVAVNLRAGGWRLAAGGYSFDCFDSIMGKIPTCANGYPDDRE
eukprot:scaffold39911_cov189-Skeletonema_dohrnii-CCMP3373.AAC.1